MSTVDHHGLARAERVPRGSRVATTALVVLVLAAGTHRFALAGWGPVPAVPKPIETLTVYRDTLLVRTSRQRACCGEQPLSMPSPIVGVARYQDGAWQTIPAHPWVFGRATERASIVACTGDRLLLRFQFTECGGTRLLCYDGSWRVLPDLSTAQPWPNRSTSSAVFDPRGALMIARSAPPYGSAQRAGVCVWEPPVWRVLPFDGSTPLGALIVPVGSEIYVGALGEARTLDDGYHRRFVRPFRILRWEEGRWETLQQRAGESLLAMTAFQDHLVAAFSYPDSSPRIARVMELDGGRWRPLGTPLSGNSGAGMVSPGGILEYDGRVVIAGAFSELDGRPCRRLAFWEGTHWCEIGGGVGSDPYPQLHILASQGSLWIGGTFDEAGGLPYRNLARWDGPLVCEHRSRGTPHMLPTQAASPRPPSIRLGHPVTALAVPADGRPPDFHNGDFAQWAAAHPDGWRSAGMFPFAVFAPRDRRTRDPVPFALTRGAAGGIVLTPDSLRAPEVWLFQALSAEPLTHYRARATVRALESSAPALLPYASFVAGCEPPILVSLREGESQTYEIPFLTGQSTTFGSIGFGVSRPGVRLEVGEVSIERVPLTLSDSFEQLVREVEQRYVDWRITPAAWDSLVAKYRAVVPRVQDAEGMHNMLREMLAGMRDWRFVTYERGGCGGYEHLYSIGESRKGHRAGTGVDRAAVERLVGPLQMFRSFVYDARLPNDVVYLQLVYPWPEVAELDAPDSVVARLRAPGVVLDLRAWDGLAHAVAHPEHARTWARRFAGLFAADTLTVARGIVRDGGGRRAWIDDGPLVIEPTRSELAGTPVVCLVGPGTQDVGAELAMMLHALPNVVLMGAPTGGSAESREFLLPTGMPIRFPTRLWRLPDGCVLDSDATIDPDIRVATAPAADLVLDQGLRTLAAMLAPAPSPDRARN